MSNETKKTNAEQSAYEVALDRANILLRDENYAAAQQHFQKALDENPRSVDAYCGLYLVSIQTPSFEALAERLFIPTDDRLYQYAKHYVDETVPVGNIDELCGRYEVEYFLTREEIAKISSYGGRNSKQAALIKFMEAEKARLLESWKKDVNIQHAYEFCAGLEEQFNLSGKFNLLTDAMDRQIETWKLETRFSYKAEIEQIPTRLKEAHATAQALRKKADSEIARLSKELNESNYQTIYEQAKVYEPHPDGAKLLARCKELGEKGFAKKELIISGIAAGAYLLLSILLMIFNREQWEKTWTLFPCILCAISLCMPGVRTLINTLCEKEIAYFTPKKNALFDLGLTAMGALLPFVSVIAKWSYTEDSAIGFGTLACVLPAIFCNTLWLLPSCREMKTASKRFLSIAMFACAFVFSCLPFALFSEDCDFLFANGVTFWPHFIQPLLFLFVAGMFIRHAKRHFGDAEFALLITGESILLLLTFITLCVNDLFALIFWYIFCAGVVYFVLNFFFIMDLASTNQSNDTYCYRDITASGVRQGFDYKPLPRPSRNSAPSYDDYEDDDRNTNTDSYYNGYDDSSDEEEDTPFNPKPAWDDAADYNARAHGYQDSVDAANQTGTLRSDWYFR